MTTTRALQEVIYVVHFASSLPLTMMDMIDWSQTVAEDFPVLQQVPAWGPFQYGPAPEGMMPMIFGTPPLPRLMAVSLDQRRTLNLQADRFACTWRRLEPTGEPTPYPGFEAILSDVLQMQHRFRSWWSARFGGDPIFTFVELNYTNAFSMVTPEGNRRLSEVMTFVVPKGRQISHFGVGWMETVEPPDQARVQCGITMGQTPDCAYALMFNFAGAGILTAGSTPDRVEALYRLIHERTTEIFSTSLNTGVIGADE